MTPQNTRLREVEARVSSYLGTSLNGTWRKRSLGLISLLLGFYLGSNITLYYLEKTGQRPLIVLLMVLLIELLIRFRSRMNINKWKFHWLVIDNMRIGTVYAVVLEAFKLGS